MEKAEKIAEKRKRWKSDDSGYNEWFYYVSRASYTRRYNARIRKMLIELLGGHCVKCGFSDSRALQVDHINGGGSKENKNLKGMKNVQILKKVLGGSKEYQLLCANCNWIKRFENDETNSKYI